MSTRWGPLWAAALALGLTLPWNAAAQTLPEGTRVRLVAVGGYRADGSLVTFTRDSLVLVSEQAGRVGLALGAVRRLEAKLPAGSVWRATRRGMLFGAAVSLVAGGALAVAKGGSLDLPLTGALVLGTTGAGAVTGAVFLRGYAWRIVPLSSDATAGPRAPGPRRPGR